MARQDDRGKRGGGRPTRVPPRLVRVIRVEPATWSDACISANCVGLRPYYANSWTTTIPAVLLSVIFGAITGAPIFRPDGVEIDLAISGPNAGPTSEVGCKILFGIHPEDVSDLATIGSAKRAIVELEPRLIEPTGADVHIIFALGAGRLIGRFSPGATAGAPRPVALDLARATLFDPQTGCRLRMHHQFAPAQPPATPAVLSIPPKR